MSLARRLILLQLGLQMVLATGTFAQTSDNFVFAFTGDSIITRKLSVYDEPEFLSMIELIRSADAGFTNVEMLFHDYEYYPMASGGGTYMRAAPEMAKELAWAGFDLGSLANNHTGDYGAAASLQTERIAREAGLTVAGVGKSLAEAREAKFLETSKGRVALISVSSSFPDHARAGDTRGDTVPRPGLNPLRHQTTYHVTRDELENLRQTMTALGMDPPEEGDRLRFLRQNFVVSDRTDVVTEPDPGDMAAIGSVVRNAKELADYVVLTIHAHEGEDGSRFVPAQFLVTFARRMIEEGADVFVGHGPHALRAIEIYQGKPIFYSLGDFMFQNETLQRLPQENYEGYDLGADKGLSDFNRARYKNDTTGFPTIPEIWESVIAVPEFNDGKLVKLELHPISLGFGEPRMVRGRPKFAEPELATKILNDVKRLSEPYGTVVDNVGGVGIVRVSGPNTN